MASFAGGDVCRYPTTWNSGEKRCLITPMLDNIIRKSHIEIVAGLFSVIRLPAGARFDLPAFVIARDSRETTAIVPQEVAESAAPLAQERNFRILRVNVATPFAAPGFLAAICTAIADKGANVFVVSTFSFDYILVRQNDLHAAVDALRAIGFEVKTQDAEL